MALHKAPTAVTIAPTRDESGLSLWVRRYWKVGALIVIAAAAMILIRHVRAESDSQAQEESWEKLTAVASENPSTGLLSGSPEQLKAVYEKVKGTPTGAWALYLAATSAHAEEKYDEAKALLEQLQREYPDHPLAAQTFSPDGQSPAVSAVARLQQRIEAERSWKQSHASLFENAALPADAPRVRLNTDRGAIVVGLYTDLAPKHAENFLKLVREGYYSGTKFHRIVRGFLVQGGDPNTIKGEPATWGQGGPGYTLDREDSPLRHFPGVLSAAAAPGAETKTSGSQFILTSGAAHALDDNFVPFGRVLEGMEVISAIDQGAIADGAIDRPTDPVTIQSAEVL